jgi:hypothetical protein
MHCAVQCLEAMIFDWSTTMIACMKRQLIEFYRCTNKNFGFGMVLSFFFFERVPSLSSREIVRGHITSFLALCRWVVLFPRQGGRRTQQAFDDKFFDWWARQIPMIQEYPYVGISFLIYPDMLMPPCEEYDEIGNIYIFFKF